MSEYDEDVKGDQVPSESSTENTEKETVTEDVKKSEEPMIPKSRFDEVNEEKKKLEAQLAEKLAPNKQVADSDDEWKQWMEFTIENRDLDKEELSVIKRLNKAGTPLDKVLEDDVFKAFQEKHRTEKVEGESSPASNRSKKVVPEKPVSEMTEAEHREFYKKMISK